ncbi:MAG: shikimate kinase [Clostridia bacterium]|nr:shikimate kinase [Clostridia bacterium]
MTEKDLRCGLIGEKLSHSYSPEIHASLGKQYEYKLIELEKEELCDFFRSDSFDAVNVTIPYKKECMKYLDVISSEALGVGAVNTVVRKGGKLCGYNTDVYGIEASFKKAGIDVKGKKALVLGTGGASLAAIYFLSSHGANVINVSRSKKEGCITYSELSMHRDAKILINATPVGMYPNEDASPLSLTKNYDSLEFIFDMIYNPFRTRLLLEAESLGIPCMNGLYMLTAQAARAAEHFCGTDIPTESIDRAYAGVMKKCVTISLVGMPGCGKSTVGRLLADKLSLGFCDADEYFSQKYGVSPAEVITEKGEPVFRDMEEICIDECTKRRGVLSTGGGAVLREKNRERLRMHGPVLLIERGNDELSVEGRPLSAGRSLDELYRERRPYYEAARDIKIQNVTPKGACERAEAVLSDMIFFGGKEK